MNTGDIIIAAVVFWFVQSWKRRPETEGNMSSDKRLLYFYKFFRQHGTDREQGEEVRKELIRRGIDAPPDFSGTSGNNDAEVMARLERLLESTPYVHRDLSTAVDERAKPYTPNGRAWIRAADPDDS